MTKALIPPQHIEAERSVLGAMLLNRNAIDVALDIIGQDTELFYVPAHREIYSAILHLFDANVPVDLITLSDIMIQNGSLERCGGAVYVAELTDAVPSSANADHYAKIILERGLKRRSIDSLTKAVARLYDDDTNAVDIAQDVCRDACAIIEGKSASSMHTMFEGINASMKEIHRRRNLGDVPIGISTGMPKVDSLMLGLRPGTLNMVAARPSVGKSAIAANFAHNVAMQGVPVLFFSVEMDFLSISNRILTISTQTPYKALCDVSRASQTNSRLATSAGLLADSRVVIDDADSLSMMMLRSKARRFAMRHSAKTPVIIIDYLQNCTFVEGRNKTRNEQIGEFTRDCKRLAKELSCPIVLLCQLSREAEGKDDPFDCLSCLKESGSIEQDADTVLILTRNYPKEMLPIIQGLGIDEKNVINAAVAKNRDGPVGMCSFVFARETQHIQALADYVSPWKESEEEESF